MGVGQTLLHLAESQARDRGCDRIHLEVQATNIPALFFYLSAGYCLFGRTGNYYSDGGMALRLRKRLSS